VISFISIGFIDPGGRVGWRLGYALFTSVGLAVIIASATGGFPRQLHTHAPSARPGA
jgi:hypothetical protein